MRKAFGLMFVVFGGILCLTCWGAIAGLPMILIGGCWLFK